MMNERIAFSVLASLLVVGATAARADVPNDRPGEPATVSVEAPQAVNIVAISYVHADGSPVERKAAALDLTRRLANHVAVHGAVAVGRTEAGMESGHHEELRIGVEARGTSEMIRVIGGIDAGYRFETVHTSQTSTMQTRDTSTLVAVPRVGLEVGARYRARLVLELPIAFDDAFESADTSGGGPVSATWSLGAGFAF